MLAKPMLAKPMLARPLSARTVERQQRQLERCLAFDYLWAFHYLSTPRADSSAEDATIQR
jgi:hypothetical protein